MRDQLDLLLIHPGGASGVYGGLADELTAVEPPLWCRLIAGYVRDHGHSVRIADAEALRLTPREVGAYVANVRPRLTCIVAHGHQPSASTQMMTAARAIADEVKHQAPYWAPVMLVGGHVAALPERTLREEPTVDYACVGEGPVTVAELLRLFKSNPDFLSGDLHAVPGLVHREPGLRVRAVPVTVSAVVVNPAPPLLDMTALHGDVWDLLPMGYYRSHNWQAFGDTGGGRQPYASVMTSLGCPYRCSFCCINAPFGGNRYRMREPAAVVGEIAKLYDQHGVRTFKIVDEMFVLNEQHYTAIAEGLVAAGIGDAINIWAYARVDTVRPNKLDLLRRAGVKWLALGIESGSKYVRDGASKRLRNDDIAGVVRSIQNAGINVIGNYIFGLPDDDLGTMDQTLNLALELNTEFANFYCAQAYPGSSLYAEAIAKGWALPETWAGYSQHGYECRPLDARHVDAATILAFRDRAFRTYFQSPAYLAMVERRFGLDALHQVGQMLRHKLPRRLLADRPVHIAEMLPT